MHRGCDWHAGGAAACCDILNLRTPLLTSSAAGLRDADDTGDVVGRCTLGMGLCLACTALTPGEPPGAPSGLQQAIKLWCMSLGLPAQQRLFSTSAACHCSAAAAHGQCAAAQQPHHWPPGSAAGCHRQACTAHQMPVDACSLGMLIDGCTAGHGQWECQWQRMLLAAAGLDAEGASDQ